MSNPSNNGNLVGRLAKDPVVNHNSDGSKKLYLTIAVQDDYKSGPNKEYATQFIDAEHFVPLKLVQAGGGILPTLRQGMLVAVSTRMKSDSYTDKKTGEKKYRQYVDVVSLNKLSSKAEDEAREAAKAARANEGWGAGQPAQNQTAPAAPAQGAAQAPQAPAAPQGAPTAVVPDAGALPQAADPFQG